MAARSRGNGTNFDWLRKSCDISTCDLSPNGILEKYRRPIKSAINQQQSKHRFITSLSKWGSGTVLRFILLVPNLRLEY